MSKPLADDAFGAHGYVSIKATYPNGKETVFDLMILPDIIMQGQGNKWRPGVVWEPRLYIVNPFADDSTQDISEVVAYAINEGAVLADVIESDGGPIHWQTIDPAALYECGVLDAPTSV